MEKKDDHADLGRWGIDMWLKNWRSGGPSPTNRHGILHYALKVQQAQGSRALQGHSHHTVPSSCQSLAPLAPLSTLWEQDSTTIYAIIVTVLVPDSDGLLVLHRPLVHRREVQVHLGGTTSVTSLMSYTMLVGRSLPSQERLILFANRAGWNWNGLNCLCSLEILSVEGG